jgi:hypothetical protein
MLTRLSLIVLSGFAGWLLFLAYQAVFGDE